MKSCDTCPSFVTDPAQQRKLFGKIAGVPLCGRYGHVLEAPKNDTESNEALRMEMAMKCDSHGLEPTETPVSVSLRVAEPDTEILKAGAPDEEIGSCRSCANCVPDSEVLSKFGWGLPLCKAHGKLVVKERSMWRECGFSRKTGSGWDTATSDGVELIDVLKPGFRLDPAVVIAATCSHVDLTVDPQEYVTDAEVTEEDRTLGIRAWRKITDPDGHGAPVLLPIFDINHFSEEEREEIPLKGDPEHPENYLDYQGLFYSFAVESYELKETPLLQGAPGLGKTEFARALAYSMSLPFVRITFRQRMDAEALLGSPQYDPEEGTYFQPGRLPKWWERACVLLLDEPNLVEDDDVLHTIRPMTDNSSQLVVEGASGAGQRGSWRFDRDRFCFLLLAQNPSWDPRNIGTRELASADANRLSVLNLEDPPEDIVRHIVKTRCLHDGYDIPSEKLDVIMSASKDIRRLEDEGVFPDHWGTRQIIKIARKTRFYTMERAFRVAALDLYDPTVAEAVMVAVNSYLESDADSAASAAAATD